MTSPATPLPTAAAPAAAAPVPFSPAGAPRLDEDSMAELAETFRMLGDVTRVRILDALSRGELCVQDLARQVDLSESAVSHQLRLLRGTRLVRPRRAGRQVFYSLDDLHIVKLFAQGLEHVQENRRGRGPTSGGAS